MTHTSGMPAMPPEPIKDLYQKFHVRIADAVTMYSQQALEFEPGSKWMYSNPGIATLGRLVEVLSDQTFEGFIEARILKPLGMSDSFLFPPADKRDRIVTNHQTLDGKLRPATAEALGGAQKVLADSVKYAKERIQFGKPIGVHQAIKHKCADMLILVESSKSITYYAAWAVAENTDEAELAASMAKAYTSDAYRHASAENIQIHGGVGFTWEYDCHLYFKRAKAIEVTYGDPTEHRERVAQLLNL